MRRIAIAFPIVAICAALVWANHAFWAKQTIQILDFVSGTASTHTGPAHETLTADQLHQLSEWLHRHNAEWERLVVTPVLSSDGVIVTQIDGSLLIFSLYESPPAIPGWKNIIVLTRRPRGEQPDFNGKHRFSDADFQAIVSIITHQ